MPDQTVDESKPVRLRRLGDGRYGLTVDGEAMQVVKISDGSAPSTYLWELRQEGSIQGVRTFLTLADVRRWVSLSGRHSEQGS